MIFPQNKKKRQWQRVAGISFFILLLAFLTMEKPQFLSDFLVASASKLHFVGTPARESGEEALLNAKIADLEKENEILRHGSGLASKKEISAKIKLGSDYLFYDVSYIDKGSSSGVENGDIVVTDEKIFFGRVANVGIFWSKVLPMGALGEHNVLRTGQNKEIVFEAEGIGRGEMRAELGADTQLNAGDIVWLGEASEYPVGLISAVKNIEGRKLQNIEIQSPLPFNSVADVLIIKNQ